MEIFAGDVGDQGAEGVVQTDQVAFYAFFGYDGGFCGQADQFGERGSDEIVVPACGQVGCGWGEDIAAVKGGGDGGLDHPVLVGDFAGGVEAVAIEGGG